MKAIMITCIIVLFILGCSIASADTTWVHVQNISGSVTWSRSGNPYIIKGGVMVDSGGTLIIEPGVEVYFDTTTENPNAGIIIWDGGSLFVNGTATDSVFFSPRDTSIHLGNIRVRGLAKILFAKFYGMYCVWDYNSLAGGAIRFTHSAEGSEVRNCAFENNYAIAGGAIAIETEDIAHASCENGIGLGFVDIIDCRFENNEAEIEGSALLAAGYTVVNTINCVFKNNIVNEQDFGGCTVSIYSGNCQGIFANNILIQNNAYFCAGLCTQSPDIMVFNNLFYQNHSKAFGAMEISDGDGFQIINNTIVYNSADSILGGIRIASNASAVFLDNIIWGNSAPVEPQLSHGDNVEASYNNIQGGFPGTGNIDLDPQFANVAEGDFRLTCNSPCVDAGDPSDSLDPDFTRADMGAYYFHQSHGSGDANNDCRIIGSDVTFLVRYFKGLGAAPYPIWKADMNGDCNIRGSDVTYCVRYLKGIGTNPIKNIDCPNPEWSIPDTCDPCEY